MKIKIALGVLLVSMSSAVFASGQSYDRHDRNDRHSSYDRDRHHSRADRVCVLNGRAYPVGSVVRQYRRVQECERVRGRAMWINRHHGR